MYAPEIEKYYLWDSSIELVDKKQFEKAINDRRGRGGTSPSLVATECVQKNIKTVILITDGQVEDY